MIYFSGFASQSTGTESQIHGDPNQLIKLCTNLHSTFLKKSVQIHRFIHASVAWDGGTGGVCLLNAYVNTKTLGLQLELKPVIFQAFHACRLPAMGLPGL